MTNDPDILAAYLDLDVDDTERITLMKLDPDVDHEALLLAALAEHVREAMAEEVAAGRAHVTAWDNEGRPTAWAQ